MVSEEVVVFDNLRGTISFVIHVDPHEAGAFDAAQARLDELSNQTPQAGRFPAQSEGKWSRRLQTAFAEEDFIAAVERIKEYILAGDVCRWCWRSGCLLRSAVIRLTSIGR